MYIYIYIHTYICMYIYISLNFLNSFTIIKRIFFFYPKSFGENSRRYFCPKGHSYYHPPSE